MENNIGLSQFDKNKSIIRVLLIAIALIAILILLTNWFFSKSIGVPVLDKRIETFNKNNFSEIIAKLSKSEDYTDKLILAASYLQQGSFEFREKEASDKALAILTPILKQYPDNVEALRLAGYAYEIIGKYKEAIALYTRALTLAPSEPALLAQRGHAFALDGNKPASESDIIKAYKLQPGNPLVAQNAARVFLEKNDINRAKVAYNQVSDAIDAPVRMKSEANSVLSSLYLYADGNTSLALRTVDKAISMDPGYYLPYISKAKILLTQNKSQEAFDNLKKAISFHKDSQSAYEWLGIVYNKEGQYTDSINSLQYSMSLLATDNTIFPEEKPIIESRIEYFLALNYANPGTQSEPNPMFNKQKALDYFKKAHQNLDLFTLGLIKIDVEKGAKGPLASLIGIAEYDKMASALMSSFNIR